MTQTQVLDWSEEPQELELRDGFDGVVRGSASIDAGSYDWLQVSYEDSYKLKAYAYFDRNNDGTPDATMYTTTAGVELVLGMLDMASVPAYDYLHYEGSSNGAVSATITVPSTPLVVSEDGQLFIRLNIDTYHAVKAWDGRLTGWGTAVPALGTSVASDFAPDPGAPFNSAQVGPDKKYQLGTPAFARVYVPMFVTASDTDEAVSSHTYLIASTSTYSPYNTSVFTVVFDGDEAPVIGQLNGGDGDEHLHIGPMAKHFEANADGSYNFYTGGTTGMNKPEWNDGGFFYSSDITKASHRVLNFMPIASINDSNTALLGNASRCNDEYNYCVADADGVKSADNQASSTVYIKRVR